MMFLTTVGLMVVLQIVSHLGAKTFLEDVATDADHALHELSPMALGRRFLSNLSEVVNPCVSLGLYANELQRCQQEHPYDPNPSFPQTAINMVRALFRLVRQIGGESWTGALVDLLQLVAGFSAALVILSRANLLRAELSYFLMMAFIPLGILCACLLSLPLLWLVRFTSEIVGEVLPAPLHLSVFGGGWSAFMAACYGRTFEAAIHEKFSGLVERTLTRHG